MLFLVVPGYGTPVCGLPLGVARRHGQRSAGPGPLHEGFPGGARTGPGGFGNAVVQRLADPLDVGGAEAFGGCREVPGGWLGHLPAGGPAAESWLCTLPLAPVAGLADFL